MTNNIQQEPTQELYQSLQIAYDFFNKSLFENELPEVIFTVQRKSGTMGFFAPKRWGNLNGKECHEIAMNPSYVANSRLIEVMKTLVHEMCHCWQFTFGKPSRKSYHNKEWAMKMIKVGLMPSTTGEPGGAITGQFMSDYVIDGGPFLKSFLELKDTNNFQLSWIDRFALPRLTEPVISPVADENAVIEKFENSTGDTDALTVKVVDPETANEQEVLVKPYYDQEITYIDDMPNFFTEQPPSTNKTKSRYVCGCNNRVYGKLGLQITCKVCGQDFEWREYQHKKDPN